MSNVMTPEFRVSYPNLFKARKNDLNGKEEYSVVALFPLGADLTALKKAAEAAVAEKWGNDKTKWPTGLKSPFRLQDDRIKFENGKEVIPDGIVKGAIFLNLKAQQKPGVVDEQVQDVIDPSKIYAGCYGRATVRAYAYDQKGNKGVAFGLQNFQKTRDGEPIGGRSSPQSDFQPIAGASAGPASAGNATDLFG